MIHKHCGGNLKSYKEKRNKLVLARYLSGTDHPVRSKYSGLSDKLLCCDGCGLIGIEF